MAQSIQQNNPEKKKPATENATTSTHPYDMQHIPLDNPEYINEVPQHLQNKDLPGFPSTIVAVGRPGSGKTNVLMNFLTRKELWNGFYDKIYLLGPTVKSDKLFKKIKVPEDQIVTDPDQFLGKLLEWTTEQVERVEHDPATAPKCLFIFEDITSYRMTIQTHPDFIKCFTTIRHHKASAYTNVHKFCALERTARLNCMHILVWPVNKTDIKAIYEDYGTSDFDKEDFKYICEFAWTPDEKNKKPFLYINLYAPKHQRFRKCFTDIINAKLFDGMHKKRLKERKTQMDSMGSKNSRKRKRQDDITDTPPEKNQKVESGQKQDPSQKTEDPFQTSDPSIPQNVGTRSVRDSVLAYLH